jgi:hypothetical protein
LLSTVVLVWEVAAIAGGPDDDPCRPADWCVLHDTQVGPPYVATCPRSFSSVIALCPVAEPEACNKDGPELVEDTDVETLKGITWLFLPYGESHVPDVCGALKRLGLFCDESAKRTTHYASWRPRPLDLQELGSLGSNDILGAAGISAKVKITGDQS